MLSPQVSVTTPDGANLPATSPRRRGLSYLRGLSQNRLSTGGTSDVQRTSPRNYFVRSISYNESRNLTSDAGRHRSSSRPNEPTGSIINEPQLTAATATPTPTRDLSPSAETRRARSVSRQQEGGLLANGGETALASDDMARQRTSSSRRAVSTNEPQTVRINEPASGENSQPQASTRNASARTAGTTNGEGNDTQETKSQLPTIRFFPHQEMRNGRQSLNFTPVSRTLPSESSIIRVGRYSEREGIPTTNPTVPSDAPVGFKSKVVSRKHCEFSFVNGQWHVKDVASSSGTFLNHIRLSQPNLESRLFPVKDGDILQLGIDFRGGEEMIFRCVKIRIECNRSWQKRPNNFNKTRHAQLQSLAKDQPTAGENSGDCSICLGSVLPCQSLFIAPCAHVWHYKCIRPMLEGKNSTYPQFQCPNCRAYSDLSADVDVAPEDMDDWMENSGDGPETNDEDAGNEQNVTTNGSRNADPQGNEVVETAGAERARPGEEAANRSSNDVQTEPNPSMNGSGLLARRQAANPVSSDINSVVAIDMPDRLGPDEAANQLEPERTRTESPDSSQIIAGEGPLTPRNNAGPFVFDGSAGRSDSRRLIVSAIAETSE